MQDTDQIKAVQKCMDYITENINEKISLVKLSQTVGYSPWHTSKLFKQFTGLSPLEYINALRLSRAALSLGTDSKKIIDVALDFAFGSHEGFTRAFMERFGVSPKDYRKKNLPIPLFMPKRLNQLYLKSKQGELEMSDEKNNKTVFVQVVERPARKMILKRGIKAHDYFEYCEELGCDIWQELCEIKDALQEPMGLWLPDSMQKEGTSKYVQGVEIPADYSGPVREGYEVITLPPCKMMVFQGPPFKDEDFENAISNIWEIMQEYNPEFYGFQWADEDGPRFQLAPFGERGYIEGRPVRPV